MNLRTFNSVDICINIMDTELRVKVNIHRSLGDLKANLAEKFDLKAEKIRFLYYGQRVKDNETPESLGLENGDLIEVVTELKGGGRKNKRETNIAANNLKILEILDNSADEDDILKVRQNKTEDKDVSKSSSEYVTRDMATSSIDEESKQNENIVKVQNSKRRFDELEEPHEIIKKRQLTKVESGFSEVQDTVEKFSNDFPKQANQSQVPDFGGGLEPIEDTCDKNENMQKKIMGEMHIDSEILTDDVDTEKSLLKTPQKCEKLYSKYSLKTPSPHIKQAKVSEDEMRSFSFAVHLFAQYKYGGTKILQQERLKIKDFQEVINFAGPGTNYNLLKNRTASQYKYLWRNLFRSKQTFRGHPVSGYENASKLHSPSKVYCPFQHCSTGILSPLNGRDVDLMLITPEKLKERSNVKELSSKNLFNASTSTKKNENDKIPSEKPNEGLKKCVFKCKQIDCSKEFTSVFGLKKHAEKDHSELSFTKSSEVCEICEKPFFNLDRHIKTVHINLMSVEICEICGKSMKKGMKKHRGVCKYCPVCGKEIPKRLRLLKHIEHCKQLTKRVPEQIEPLDLTSPMKHIAFHKNAKQTKIYDDSLKATQNVQESLVKPNKPHSETQEPTLIITESQHESIETQPDIHRSPQITNRNMENNNLTHQLEENKKLIDKKEKGVKMNKQKTNPPNLEAPRTKYPFDLSDDEDYMSEFEDKDDTDFTKMRRENKDIIELRLRDIDGMVNSKKEGDEVIMNKFRSFMERISNIRKDREETKHNVQPSTVSLYTRAIQNDLLTVLHELFEPFDSRWLLDCTTEKQCTFQGEKRSLVPPKEPIYLTPQILRTALLKHDGVESGHQRSMLVAATTQFMKFIELEFSEKFSVWGREPLDKVFSYHNAVKCFIDGNKIWKTCNKDRWKQLKNNQVLKDIENPNIEAEKLESYTQYLRSPERLNEIKKYAELAKRGPGEVSNKEFVQCGHFMMGEFCIVTGVRPVAVYRMPVGGYTSKKEGFNPYQLTNATNDCVLEEEEEDMKLYRRVNPNLPPKHLACKHQIENKSATCPEDCEDKCEPDGFNIFCYWDKTRDTKGGPSYIHLPTPIKELLDLYDIIKIKFFEGKKDLDWLNHKHTNFFLNSSGSPFTQINLKHISEVMGMDVTAYDFRRIVVTWAVSHESEEIRKAESETLRHGDKVAYDHYVQNKQLKPQTLIQTYVQQEDVIPVSIRKEIRKAENKYKSETSEIEQTRQKKQHESMIEEKKRIKKVRIQNKPLGPKHRLLETDKNELKTVIEKLTGKSIQTIVKFCNAFQWRQFIVRLLCKTQGVQGEKLKDLWTRIYKGDLEYGVRDIRFKAKQKNWPRQKNTIFVQKNDRNTFIAGTIFNALKSDIKAEARDSYLQLIK